MANALRSTHPIINATNSRLQKQRAGRHADALCIYWRAVLGKRKRVNYESGDMATISGIYQVEHSKDCLPDQVIVLEGKRFPKCQRCGGNVTYRLKTAAPHIRSDKDFSQ